MTEAVDGDHALAVVQAGGFDAVLSDMVMPGEHSGIMVLEKAHLRWPKAGTILMSGYTEDAMLQQGGLPDHVQLLIKPFTKAALANALRQAIDAGACTSRQASP